MNTVYLKLALLVLLIPVLFAGCSGYEKAVEGVGTVAQGAVLLKDYYKTNHQLPADNAELLRYSEEKNDTLDLSGFSEFNYYLSGDTAITIDYQSKITGEMKGSFSISLD